MVEVEACRRGWRVADAPVLVLLLAACSPADTPAGTPGDTADDAGDACVEPAGAVVLGSYGGDKRVTLDASGFFRTEQVCGRWWLVDPEGHPALTIGVNSANPTGDVGLVTGVDEYGAAVDAAYASDDEWADVAVERLRSWGFTTAGAWSRTDLFLPRMPTAPILYLSGGDWLSGDVADWFDPAWEDAVNTTVATTVAPAVGDPNVVGWFLDNETRWGPDWRGAETLLQLYLVLPADAPGKAVAVDFLLAELGSVEAANAALGTTYADRSAMLADTAGWDALDAGASTTEAALTTAFLEMAAERYFSVTAASIRAVDPDHLLLGNRDISVMTRAEVHLAAARYNDVLAINNYVFMDGIGDLAMQISGGLDPADGFSALHTLLVAEGLDRPMMVSEFGFRAADAGLPNSWPPIYPTSDTQAERADAMAEYVRGHSAVEWIVGWHWFRWVDEPADGRFDGEDNNFGLVNLADEPYAELTAAFAEVNLEAYTALRVPGGG